MYNLKSKRMLKHLLIVILIWQGLSRIQNRQKRSFKRISRNLDHNSLDRSLQNIKIQELKVSQKLNILEGELKHTLNDIGFYKHWDQQLQKNCQQTEQNQAVISNTKQSVFQNPNFKFTRVRNKFQKLKKLINEDLARQKKLKKKVVQRVNIHHAFNQKVKEHQNMSADLKKTSSLYRSSSSLYSPKNQNQAQKHSHDTSQSQHNSVE